MNRDSSISLSMVRELYESKKYTTRQIAIQLGISRSYLWKFLSRHGVILERNNQLYKLAGFSTKDEFLSRVSELYNRPLTVKQIAIELNINYRALDAFLRRNHFDTRDNSEALGVLANDIAFTRDEIEVINGLLLGDGHIELRSNVKVNYTANLVYTCKHKLVLEELAKQLQRLHPKVYPKTYRSKGKIRSGYRLVTQAYKSILELRRKWYPNNIKIVPHDITLPPETCYWWYLGDGYSRKSICFCTHSFKRNEVEGLIELLPVKAILGITKCRGKQYPIIRINQINDRIDFLGYIGPCRHYIYSYKWTLYDTRNYRIDCDEAFKRRLNKLPIFSQK